MKTEQELKLVSPLIWAYLGDAVYELYIREHLINTTNLKPHKLHIETTKYVKAKAQAETLKKIEPFLTEEEIEIVKRGRNTKTHSAPKNVDLTEYMYATAFETLIGYLHVTKQEQRLTEILQMCLNK